MISEIRVCQNEMQISDPRMLTVILHALEVVMISLELAQARNYNYLINYVFC